MGERARQRVLERFELHDVCLPLQRALATTGGPPALPGRQ
jgi:hypothetical protein